MSDKRCPVGGVDRSGKIDKISLQNAVETPFWMAVWAAEPERLIDVRMSYSDLKIICDLIDSERKKIQVNRMNDDLISRKSLIENLNKFAPEHYNALVNDLIAKEPTAFDKEEVIEELDKLTGEECTLHECGIRSERCKPCIAKKAIEIVEKGGIE